MRPATIGREHRMGIEDPRAGRGRAAAPLTDLDQDDEELPTSWHRADRPAPIRRLVTPCGADCWPCGADNE
jgi:hypothetical protein